MRLFASLLILATLVLPLGNAGVLPSGSAAPCLVAGPGSVEASSGSHAYGESGTAALQLPIPVASGIAEMPRLDGPTPSGVAARTRDSAGDAPVAAARPHASRTPLDLGRIQVALRDFPAHPSTAPPRVM